jgi:RNA polymerase sigma factor (sigma-70 family)
MARADLQSDEATLYERYHARLERHVRAAVMAAPAAVVEDACAAAWLVLLRQQPRRTTAYAWLRVVAVREAWRLLAREQRELSTDVLLSAETVRPTHPAARPRPLAEDNLARPLAARTALRALAALPSPRRETLVLRVAGFTHREIATATASSPRTVQRRLHDARRVLAGAGAPTCD